jgi:hypothetical protein
MVAGVIAVAGMAPVTEGGMVLVPAVVAGIGMRTVAGAAADADLMALSSAGVIFRCGGRLCFEQAPRASAPPSIATVMAVRFMNSSRRSVK